MLHPSHFYYANKYMVKVTYYEASHYALILNLLPLPSFYFGPDILLSPVFPDNLSIHIRPLGWEPMLPPTKSSK
jgi:hypothetical protein